jgi:hypothetical protein
MSNKRTIPEIRTRLLQIAEEHGVPEIVELVDEMYRKRPIRRAPVRSQKLTPALAAEIRAYARTHPDMHQQDIAETFGVNHGRVSQAMNNTV